VATRKHASQEWLALKTPEPARATTKSATNRGTATVMENGEIEITTSLSWSRWLSTRT
jgi:hypothetical protein